MSDELQAQFAVPGAPDAVIAAWRADPQKPIADGGFELEDESYNGRLHRARYSDAPAKLMKVLRFGMYGQDAMGSVWNLNALGAGPKAGSTNVVSTWSRPRAVYWVGRREQALPGTLRREDGIDHL
jgi:hypothetical protein